MLIAVGLALIIVGLAIIEIINVHRNSILQLKRSFVNWYISLTDLIFSTRGWP